MKIKSLTEFPKEKHYAVLVFKSNSIYHEGDGRSRTHPGHGYGAYTETINTIEYLYFNKTEELKSWIIDADKKGIKYQVIHSEPVSVAIKAEVYLI